MHKLKQKILTVGGGSAGHVSPVIAVIDELLSQNPEAEIRFWCDRKFFSKAASLFQATNQPVKLRAIASGKLRRYHGVSLWRQLLDTPTVFRNIADIFLIGIGFLQSLILLSFWRPDVVFCKGGFVCLPVGYAAWLLKIPLVLHDSDAHPGLTNRLLASKAQFIATGAPLKYYRYPKDKAVYSGLPVKPAFQPASAASKQATKKSLGLKANKPLIVVIGGGLGAKPINEALLTIGSELIKHGSVVHICGSFGYHSLLSRVPQSSSYQLKEFISHGQAELLAAADVLVSRAGASALAEAAAVGAPTIIIPNNRLVGGHQTKNAAVFTEAEAATVLAQQTIVDQPIELQKNIIDLLQNRPRQNELRRNIQTLARPKAAAQVAELIVRAAES